MLGFGALEVAIPAFADDLGSPGLSGVLLALWALGSTAGGLWFGARVVSISLPRQYRLLLLGVTIGLAPLAWISSPWALGVLLFLGGTAIAPTLTVQNTLVGSIAPVHATTEAFTWLSTTTVGASAVGAARRRRADRGAARGQRQPHARRPGCRGRRRPDAGARPPSGVRAAGPGAGRRLTRPCGRGRRA